jgi:excisionase family DNA binding protein
MALARPPVPELRDELTKPFYSPAEVAKIASLSSGTILNYIHSGKLAHVRLSEKTIRIPRRAVLKLLGEARPRRPRVEHPDEVVED